MAVADTRTPALTFEQDLVTQGLIYVAGVDEAGRGAWAGPVTAGAAILHLEQQDLITRLDGVRDSKLCTPRQRDALYDLILAQALAWGVGAASALEIDQVGIVRATKLAMSRAVMALEPAAQALLIDGRRLELPAIDLPQKCLVKGELKSLSIAAGSILAKVTRDRLMIEAALEHPGYAFEFNKGYGTARHLHGLQQLGPCPIHRRSFRPVQLRLHLSEGGSDAARPGA